MGAYTSLHIVPAEDREWVPDKQFFEDVARHYGLNRVRFMTCYDAPLDWLVKSDDLKKHVILELLDVDISISEALDHWERCRAVSAIVMFRKGKWNDHVYDALRSVPDEVAGDFGPLLLSFTIGSFSLPGPEQDSTLGWFSCELRISGDGMPFDWEEYVRLARRVPPIAGLLNYLGERSGKHWDILMSSSY